jgi:hypothetical protein
MQPRHICFSPLPLDQREQRDMMLTRPSARRDPQLLAQFMYGEGGQADTEALASPLNVETFERLRPSHFVNRSR